MSDPKTVGDLVDRLRDEGRRPDHMAIRCEAADEIERLRELIRRWLPERKLEARGGTEA